MATTSINGDPAVRFASAVAARPATDVAGLERFSIPAGEPAPAPSPMPASLASPVSDSIRLGPTTTPSSPSSKGDAAGPAAHAQRPAYHGPVLVDAGGVVSVEAALQEQDPVSGQIGDIVEARPLRVRRDEDQATPANETGLGGLPWLPQQQASGAAMPASEGARTPQVPSDQEGDRDSSASPVNAAPLRGLPVQRHAPSLPPLAEAGGSGGALLQHEQGRAFVSATKGTEMQPITSRQGGDPAIMGPLGGTAATPSFPQQPARQAFVAMADGAGTEAALAKQDAKAPSASSPVRSGTLSQMPPQAGRAGLPLTDGTGPLPAPSVQDRQERGLATLPGQASPLIAGNGGLSAAPPQAGNAQPPATAGHSAATAPVPAIASPAVAAEAVTSAEERNDDVAVPADGTAPNPTATAIFALAPPELVAPPAPANAPAMAIQAGAAPPSNASAIVSPGTGTAQAGAGRPAAVPAPGTDRPAASERETSSAKAFDELASASAMAPDDFASAPTAPFGPVPAAHIAAPAPEAAGFLPQAQAAPVPLGAVPMTIGLRSLAGSNRFEISLDPKDLGRIDVNLDIDKDSGTVTAHLTVDRPETLALLQRDVGNLQQALSQAGFDAGEAAINLSLRSDTGSNGGNGAERDGGGGREGRSGTPGSDLKDPRLSNDAVPLRMLRGLGGIDIRI